MTDHELNQAASEAGKVEGMSNAEKGAPEGWIEQAVEGIRWLALRFPFVTADDVWAMGLSHPRESRALGPCFTRAKQLRLVEPTKEFVLTIQSSRHRSPIRVWRSLLSGRCDEFTENALYSREFMESIPPPKELLVALEEMRRLSVNMMSHDKNYKPSPEFVKLGKWVAEQAARKD